MSQPRKHHFLPQFYLRNFSPDEISLTQIEKRSGKAYGGRIKDLAAIRDFHRLDFDDAEDPQALEKQLAYVEGEMSADIAALLRNGLAEKRALVQTIGFVSLLRMRVPAVKKHIEASLSAAVRVAAEALERQGKLPPAPPGLEEALKVANLKIEINNWKCMEHMFNMAFQPSVLDIMCNMRAVLLRAPSGSFLTSDQPVALFHPNKDSPYGVGPATPGVEISAPLSSTTLLLLTHDERPDEERTATAAEVFEYNRRTIVMAEQYIYAQEVSAPLIDLVRKFNSHSAGLCFDMLPGVGGTYQILRCVPVYPAGV